MKNVGKSRLQREISIAFFRTAPSSTTLRIFLFFILLFLFSVTFSFTVSLPHPVSYSSPPLSYTTFYITPARTNDPYNRSLPRCACGFHIKESYLLMRSNYLVHNGWRQDATVKSVGGVESKRWARVEFAGTAIVPKRHGGPMMSPFGSFKQLLSANKI